LDKRLGIIFAILLMLGSLAMVFSNPVSPDYSYVDYDKKGLTFNYVEVEERFILMDFAYVPEDSFCCELVVPIVNFEDGSQFIIGEYRDNRIIVAVSDPQANNGDITGIEIVGYSMINGNKVMMTETTLIEMNIEELQAVALGGN
jgi:hypothetical protein